MSELPPRQGLANAAWVTIPTKLSAPALTEFCVDVERLIRLNPYLKIFSWQYIDRNSHLVECENHSNELLKRLRMQFAVQYDKNEISLHYSTGIKHKTYFIIEAMDNGAQLTIIDDYGDQDDDECVDKSLSAWARALERFFNHYVYLRHIPFVKKIINRFWIRLSPMARRISYILVVITIIEIIALLLFVLIMSLV